VPQSDGAAVDIDLVHVVFEAELADAVRAWEAKASLISQTDVLDFHAGQIFNSLGMAYAGPTPISSGRSPRWCTFQLGDTGLTQFLTFSRS
jgi:hypothetical protein